MKFITLFLASFVLSIQAFAQVDSRIGRHIFDYDIQLSPCNFAGTVTGAAAILIEKNTIFTIRNVVGTNYVIHVERFTSRTAAAAGKNLLLVADAAGNDFFFLLPESVYLSNAVRLEKKGNFTVGAATTLIKIRPGRKDPKNGYNIYSEFGNDFNIGVSAGWKIRPNRHYPTTHSVVGGLSFSSIKVTPYTSRDFLTSESTQSCVTFSAGYVLDYNKFQVSLFSGIDLMSGEIGRHWIYKDRPWLGLGLGYQIFRAEGETTNIK